jgi:hypothetical protein
VGYLNPAEVARLVSEHLAGRANHENKLWGLMNLVLWQRQQASREAYQHTLPRAASWIQA